MVSNPTTYNEYLRAKCSNVIDLTNEAKQKDLYEIRILVVWWIKYSSFNSEQRARSKYLLQSGDY